VHLWTKLQSLAKYSNETLAAEIRRLANFTPESLKKELEPKVLAPVNRLPSNILSDIFLLGLRDEHADDEHFELPQRYQGVISLVCRHWKIIIEHTRLAWANITVLDRQPFAITQRFLRLSGTCLINIAVDWSEITTNGGGAYKIDEMDRLFALILPEAHRWRSLYVIVVDYSLILHVVQRLQPVAAPNLSMLWLSNPRALEQGEDFPPPEMATEYKLFQSSSGAPILRDVTLWGVHIDWSSSFLSSHLRKLALCYHSFHIRPAPQRFFDILSACSETLQEFCLEDSGPALKNDEEWMPYVSSKIELPNLHTLTVNFLPPKHAWGVFNTIVARNVKDLTLNLEFFDARAEWNPLIRQLCTGGFTSKEPMFPTLTSLRVLGLSAEPFYLGILLYYYPTITSLHIDFRYTPHELLDVLGTLTPQIGVPPSELPEWASALHSRVVQYQDKPIKDGQIMDEGVGREPWMCPDLQKLMVWGISGKRLRLLIARRQEGGVPLKEVQYTYTNTRAMRSSDRAWLKANLDVFKELVEAEDDRDLEDEEELEFDDELLHVN
jgi:hypothetical protein